MDKSKYSSSSGSPKLRMSDSDSPVEPSNRVIERRPAPVVLIGRPPSLILWTALFFFLGFVAVLLMGLWMMRETNGMVWADKTQPMKMFSYHPLFMILGLLYIHGFTNLIYRLFPDSNYLFLRITHGLLQAAAAVLMGLGIYAVYFYKTYAGKPRRNFYHFITIHSWIGLVIVFLVALQWVGGFLGLLFPAFHSARNFERYRKVHRFFGIVIFFMGCANALVGIDQIMISSVMNVLAYGIVLYAALGGWILANPAFRTKGPEVVTASADERMPILSTAEVLD